jgi:hypothetical protein
MSEIFKNLLHYSKLKANNTPTRPKNNIGENYNP